MITKEDLKQEIDSGYLELVFNLLKQFPHQNKPDLSPIEYTGTKADKIAQLQASQQDSLFLNDLQTTNDDFAHVDNTINYMAFTDIVDAASLSPHKA
ncbi:MAG: hypothetical protein NTZ45_08915 [Methylococcales bacterium]|jgi:hypothetical protein|nr:hypothetical protein [Methylococcales bacterium]